MDHDDAAHDRGEWRQADLVEDYRQMAADGEREMEAEEWVEALVGDILEIA
jgi:hypothetical protein